MGNFSKSFVLILILSILKNISSRTSDDLKVTLSHGGILVGRHLVSHSGRGIKAFLGIPYAEPPINELRFQPPIPAQAWKGEKLAIKDSPICIQRDPFRRDMEIDGSEDCLYLNVYVPQNPNVKGPLPVMVFFHGGGWECGSGISLFYGPDYLMDHDVIYVSGNFRLGPLGFLSTETLDCPGNNGLKDQVEILKWIQQNIQVFGGNPDSVTIFGESAGGASVTYHMMSDMSKGLFHKGISQSGTYFNPWAQPAHEGVASNRAKKLAKLMECELKNDNWAQSLKCLKTKPAGAIMNAIYDFFEWDYDPMIPFPPVVEPKHSGAFISKHPRDEKSPHGLPIPWMTGITSEEGALKTAPLLNVPGLLDDFKANFNKVLPITLFYDHHTPEIQDKITRAIDQFYFKGDHNWSKQNHQNLTNLFTDGWFMSGTDEYLRIRLDDSNKNRVGPTYVYQFDHKGPSSFTEIFQGGLEDYYGVCHAEELQYLFPIGQGLFISALPSEKDHAVRQEMLKIWVNFANSGKPTTPENSFNWPQAKEYPLQYVRIGNQHRNDSTIFNIEKDFFGDRVKFWRQLNAHKPRNFIRDEL